MIGDTITGLQSWLLSAILNTGSALSNPKLVVALHFPVTVHSSRILLNTKGEAVREYLSQHLITSRWASESNLAAEAFIASSREVIEVR